MNDNTDILIEKALAGALSPEETTELEALLAADPALRDHLNALQRDEALLAGHLDSGLARVDWSRVRRIRVHLNLDGLLRPWALSALCAACLWQLFLVADNWWDRLGMTCWSLVTLGWAADAWLERKRTRRRLAWLEQEGQDEKDFLARYRIVVEREWKKVRSNMAGVGCAAFFLIFFAIVGKYPEACLAALAVIVVVRIFEYFSIFRPLRREREELGS